ncbi:hypothetical protein N665_1201s0005 [Sinapis alba]|nr:hypothetical protein N665_1201s0005 [Sinapis alba]
MGSVVDRNYPSAITFWVGFLGVPLHYWAIPTFESVGAERGDVKEVDLDNGRVQVMVVDFKQLCFEAPVEFHGWEEILVSIGYERLLGYFDLPQYVS